MPSLKIDSLGGHSGKDGGKDGPFLASARPGYGAFRLHPGTVSRISSILLMIDRRSFFSGCFVIRIHTNIERSSA